MISFVCTHCTAEYEIEMLDDSPVMFCPACGSEIADEIEEENEEQDE